MSDLKLNTLTDDLDLTGSQLSLVDDEILEALRQKIQIAVLLHRGEWFVNINDGVPYLTDFTVIKNNKAFIDAFMRSYIQDIEGVVNLTGYSSIFNPNLRTLNISFSATGIAGFTVEVEI